jgi:phosphoglycolate phosphatase
MGRPYRTIIFDMDGTLIDSKPGILGSLRHALGQLGHEFPEEEDLGWALGPPLDQIMARLLAPRGDTRIAEAVAFYRAHYGDGGLYDARPYDGIPDLLGELATSGRTLFVGTSKFTPFARQILDHFGLSAHFSGVYGTEPGGPVPTKADLIGSVLADRGADPADVVVVGDREHDLIGAQANGLAAVAVLYGYGSRAELAAAGADLFCETPGGLREFL